MLVIVTGVRVSRLGYTERRPKQEEAEVLHFEDAGSSDMMQSGVGTNHDIPANPPKVGEALLVTPTGKPLYGTVEISGAKNAALKGMAAALLTEEEVLLDNMPDITDVQSVAQLLRQFGAEVNIDTKMERVTIRAKNLRTTSASPELWAKTRAAIVVVGALLGRTGIAHHYTLPSGDQEIGKRPTTAMTDGLVALGATFGPIDADGISQVAAAKLTGTRIYMDYPSHTGTEALILAACRAKGLTTIVNACIEPEVVWLASLLNRMGARITGHGTSVITVEGVPRLAGTSFTCIPDRLEAGTYAIAAVLTRGRVELKHVKSGDMLPLTEKLRQIGATAWFQDDRMLVYVDEETKRNGLHSSNIQTLPFPGFPTDLQAAIVPLLTQVSGKSIVQERVYENRLDYMNELKKMGAKIDIKSSVLAEVTGLAPLRGATVTAKDIRAGVSLVLAGLVADGPTTVTGSHHIGRGYSRFIEKMTGLGADLKETGV